MERIVEEIKRSIRSNVTPVPRTGRVSIRRIDTVRIVWVSKHQEDMCDPAERATKRDTRKVADPPSDDRPRTCTAKTSKDIAEEEW